MLTKKLMYHVMWCKMSQEAKRMSIVWQFIHANTIYWVVKQGSEVYDMCALWWKINTLMWCIELSLGEDNHLKIEGPLKEISLPMMGSLWRIPRHVTWSVNRDQL